MHLILTMQIFSFKNMIVFGVFYQSSHPVRWRVDMGLIYPFTPEPPATTPTDPCLLHHLRHHHSVWLVIDNFVSSSEEGKDLSNHTQMSMIKPNRPENNVRLLSLRAGSRGFSPDYEHNPWLIGKWDQKNSLGVHFITY